MVPVALAMLLPAAQLAPEAKKPGLLGQYWDVGKEMKKFPDELVTAEKPHQVRIDGFIDFDAKEGRGFEGGRTGDIPWKEYFAVVWTGIVRLPKEGECTFYLESHDGSKLFIDGKLVVDHDGTHPLRDTASKVVNLSSGDHDLRIEYFQNRPGRCIFSWKLGGREKQVVPSAALWHPYDKEVDRESN
jgi:hypothetical protein